RVERGEIGISILKTPALKNERLLAAGDSEVCAVLPFLRTDEALLIRNAAPMVSVVELCQARVFGMPIPGTQAEEIAAVVPAAAPPSAEPRPPGRRNRLRDWFATIRSGASRS